MEDNSPGDILYEILSLQPSVLRFNKDKPIPVSKLVLLKYI
jgi:hypothetical protein